MLTSTAFFTGYGHPNIRATHPTTLEFTTEPHVTLRGDCVVGVACTMAAFTLPADFKRIARSQGSQITFEISSMGVADVVTGIGDPLLDFSNTVSMVIRKSGYVSDRTVALKADKAAADLSRRLIRHLQTGAKLEVTVTARAPEQAFNGP
ncbi:MAG: DUF371 domain-containing protein [Thermoprotei archaeon]